MGLQQTKKICSSKGNDFQNEETAHIAAENLCWLFIQQGIIIQNI
jgi:hypothetical protein